MQFSGRKLTNDEIETEITRKVLNDCHAQLMHFIECRQYFSVDFFDYRICNTVDDALEDDLT